MPALKRQKNREGRPSTRIVCNPRGHAEESTGFNPSQVRQRPHTTPAARQRPHQPRRCWLPEAIALLNRFRYEKTGKRLMSAYSLRSMPRKGEIAFMTDCARSQTQGIGFVLLVEAGPGTCTVEYIVATNPDRFPQDTVAAAPARLMAHGVALPD